MGKKAPTPPKAPDPRVTARAQSEANQDSAVATGVLNNPNINTPFGSQQVSFDNEINGIPQPTITQSLSPAEQAKVDQQNQLAQVLGNTALDKAGSIPTGDFNLPGNAPTAPTAGGPLPTPTLRGAPQSFGDPVSAPSLNGISALAQVPAFSGEFNAPGQFSGPQIQTDFGDQVAGTRDRIFNESMDLLQPDLDIQDERVRTRLRNQGLAEGDEAFSDAFRTEVSDPRDRLVSQLALQSINAGNDLQGQLFGQNLAARQQGVGEDRAMFDMQQRARQQGIDEETLGFTLSQVARNQGISEQELMFSLQQQARQQGVTEEALLFDMANQNASLGFDLASRGRAQQFGEEATAYGLGEQARGNRINEDLMQRTQPINELAAILQGSPALNTPQFQGFQGSAVAPPDVMGAHQMQYAGDLNAYNAQMQNRGSNLGALASLGGSIVGAPWAGKVVDRFMGG